MPLSPETRAALIADYQHTLLEEMEGGVRGSADLRSRHANAARDVLEAHGLVGDRAAERLLAGHLLTMLEGSIRMLEREAGPH